MNALELKIPPPLVALCLALLMWLISLVVRPFDVAFAIRVGSAIALVIVGQCISVVGMVAFRRAKTTVNPFKPTTASSLVTSGVFCYTRNPMYVGLLLTLLAWAAFLSSSPVLLFVPLYVWYINRYQICPEERALLSLFGAEYVAYKERVRRWI